MSSKLASLPARRYPSYWNQWNVIGLRASDPERVIGAHAVFNALPFVQAAKKLNL